MFRNLSRKLIRWFRSRRYWQVLAEERLREAQKVYVKYRHWNQQAKENDEQCVKARRGIQEALAIIKRFDGHLSHAQVQIVVMRLTNETGIDCSDPICRGRGRGHEGYDILTQSCLCCGDTREMMRLARERESPEIAGSVM